MSPLARVLLAEDEPHLGALLETFLVGRGHRVTRVGDGRAALEAARATAFDVALLDVVMPEMDGLAVLGALAELPLPPEAVVMTGNGTVETAIHALRLGAYDYLTKPYRMVEVDMLVRRAAEKRALRLAAAREEWGRARRPVVVPASEHPPLRDALARAAAAAAAGQGPRVVTGAPGTGRRTAARWLAALAAPAAAVVELRCTGDERRDRRALFGQDAPGAPGEVGAVALAGRGTLLLADAHRLSDALARRLLAALDGDRAAGDGEARANDPPARVLATASAAWAADAPPLAARLAGPGTLALPALDERVIDISWLAGQLLPHDAAPRRVAEDAVALLRGRSWPGNVAELRAVVEASAWRAEGEELRGRDVVAAAAVGGEVAGGDGAAPPGRELPLSELERRHIAAVLEEVGWHRGRAAQRLGISPRTLYRRIRQYGFDR